MASAACHIYIGKQREKHYLPYHADQNSLGISYHIGKRFDTQLCPQQKHQRYKDRHYNPHRIHIFIYTLNTIKKRTSRISDDTLLSVLNQQALFCAACKLKANLKTVILLYQIVKFAKL